MRLTHGRPCPFDPAAGTFRLVGYLAAAKSGALLHSAAVQDRLDALENEYRDTQLRLGDPDVFGDQRQFVALNKRLRELEGIVRSIQALREARGDLSAARELFSETEGDEREVWRAEAAANEARIEELEATLRIQLLPKDPNDDRNVIVEIRGAEGGEEANLFAADLFEMYKTVAAKRGWKFEVLAASESDMGGFTEVTVELSGDSVWSAMKHEAGVHRVQRVPVTESQGRVHTSSATVAVLPEVDEVEVAIDPGELRVDVFRASGAGGQHINKTESAVRLTHLPTGVVVSMQDQRSQTQNREKAMRVLLARLSQLQKQEQTDAHAGAKRSQIGGGGRSEKIRTYNYKDNRVTDHRIGLTVYALDRIIAGDLDEFTNALIADERARQLAVLDNA